MAANAKVCPVVGTTNTVLPPSHPDVDLDAPGQTCPVVGATTDHHKGLHKHPSVPGAASQDINNAAACPALKDAVKEPQNQALSEAVCPIVGPVSSVLPPNHPSTAESKDGDVCPVTKATIGHHKQKVHEHPTIDNAPKDAVCPVVGNKE